MSYVGACEWAHQDYMWVTHVSVWRAWASPLLEERGVVGVFWEHSSRDVKCTESQ